MTLSTTKYLFAAVGLGMLFAALVAHHQTASFISRASRAQGTVTALVPQRSGDNSSVTYRPIVRFEHEGREVQFSDSVASSPPAYYVGETVGVLYLAYSPDEARIDSFRSLWFVTSLLTGMGIIFFGIGGGLIFLPALTRRADERLLHEGRPVEADFQAVSINSGIAINGRCPYRVTAQWVDPATSRVRVFQSHNVWFDPTAYVKDRKLKVFVDPNDPDKYYVDLSFLPKLAA
jgi:hypothetical protein